MKNLLLIGILFFSGFVLGQSNNCGISLNVNPNFGECCSWDFTLSNLPENTAGSVWTFQFADGCDTSFFDSHNSDDYTFNLLSCFNRELNYLQIVVYKNAPPPNNQCIIEIGHTPLVCTSTTPDCDSTKSILENLQFYVSYTEPGIPPCPLQGQNVTAYLLSSFNFPALCYDNCPDLNDIEIIACWTDGCINYQEIFNIQDPCEDLSDVLIRPILVGSELSVTVKQEGNCCTSDYIGSATLIVEGFQNPCVETSPCNPICTGPGQRLGPFSLIENVEDCAQLPEDCQELAVAVEYVGATCDGLYNFEASVQHSSNCNIIDFEWNCWRFNPQTGMREPIQCVTGNSPNEASIDITQYAVGDAVGACVIVRDDCGCESASCDPGQTIFDLCNYDVEFVGVGVNGDYFFTFNSALGLGCDNLIWTAFCGNFDLPITLYDDGISVNPGNECFEFTVCVQLEGCEEQCLEVNTSFPQPLIALDKQERFAKERIKDSEVEKRVPINIAANSYGNKFENMLVFPNPTKNQVTVSLGDPDKSIRSLKVYNIHGQIIRQIDNLENKQIRMDVSNYSKGIYIIELYDTEEKCHADKLIIK